jgi:hypothetical protein
MLSRETSSFTRAPRGAKTFDMKKTRIVIAGGGFADLYAAKYLDKHLAHRPDIEVTLIARENFILFTPMLHEVAVHISSLRPAVDVCRLIGLLLSFERKGVKPRQEPCDKKGRAFLWTNHLLSCGNLHARSYYQKLM